MRRRLTALIGTVLAATATLTAFTTASQASPNDQIDRRASVSTAAPVAAEPASQATKPPGFYTCPAYTFCAWDGLDATGYRMEWSGTITCNQIKDLARTGWRNRIKSIQNNTTATILLYDYDVYGPLWSSARGNWGNLPSWQRGLTDQLQRTC